MVQTLMTRRELAAEGKIFTGVSAAAGQVLPIFSATAQKFGIWNPAGSGVLAEIMGVRLTYVQTTQAAGGFVLALLTAAPANLATAARITAFTETAGSLRNNFMADGKATAKVLFTPSAATVTAPIIGRHLGINQDVAPATAAVTFARGGVGEDFPDGEVMLAPGNALFICGNIATLVTLACGITWGEHDYAP